MPFSLFTSARPFLSHQKSLDWGYEKQTFDVVSPINFADFAQNK